MHACSSTQTTQPYAERETGAVLCEEAARLRDLAVNVTTVRLRTRLLEEAENHDRLALAARRGIVQPHPIALMDR